MTDAKKLADSFIHLGLGARAVSQPEFTGMEWYGAYADRYADDGAEGRLVSLYHFSSSWEVWEMHPNGSEVVVCIAGAMTLIQQGQGGMITKTELTPGEYVINEPGVWHTADISTEGSGEATAIFITAGEGTQHRPR